MPSSEDPRQREFETVFEEHFDAIHRFVHRRVGRDVADDLAAEVFAQAYARWATYDSARGAVRPWLYGIATNLLRREHRREERRLRAYARTGVDPVTALEDPAQRIDAERAGPRIAAALARLSRHDRDVLLLYAWADLSYDEIATALQLPTGTVRSRLHRARTKFAEAFALSCPHAVEPLKRETLGSEVQNG